MKFFLPFIPLLLSLLLLQATEQESSLDQGMEQLASEQDELAADVQQIKIEQTIPSVIELFDEIESIMDETTDRLYEQDTGGETIAAQTEIIEKIHQAAKSKQSQQGGGEASEALMDMMERMMGKEGNSSDQASDGQNAQASSEGKEGNSGEAPLSQSASYQGKKEQRTVPRASGQVGKDLPMEFQEALEAYNRGLETISP